jgi:putative ABC transport system permease protein
MFSSLRIAIRSLARRPAVAGVAIVSLAVGIGVNTAVFSMVDAAYLRPPAVTDPANLVEIAGHFKDSGGTVLDWSDCQDIASQTSAFSALTVTMGRGGLWRNGGETSLLLVDAVGDNYFDMLGVKPVLGQLPDAKHDYAADSEPPIVLTYWLWRERMGGRPDVIGRRMEFRDHLWRIAAVLPPQFRGLSAMGQRHVWIPVSGWARYFRGDLERGGGQFEAVARLRPGVSLDQAQAQLELLARRIEAGDSKVPKGRRLVAHSLAREMRDRRRPAMFTMAVVILVLLVACANVAAVLLSYAEARRREIGLRLSLGAGRLALLRQFLAESAVLAIAGAAAGLLLGTWLLGLVPALAPPSPVPLKFDFRIDARLLLFTSGCVLATLAIFGLAPLVYAARVSLAEAIAGARSAGRTHRSFLRYALVTTQVALSVVLVGGAVVMARALADAREIYPGYDTSRPLALVWANIGYDKGSKPEYQVYREAADRMAAVGGIETVTFARHLPLVGSGAGATFSVTPEGASPDAAPPQVYFNLVGPKFFEVVGTRMVSGRIFADSDHTGGAPVAIINGEAARRFWPTQNPLGKILRTGKEAYQVVGVMADGRIGSLHEKPEPAVILPASRMKWGETILIARTKMDPAVIVKELARAAARTNELQVYESGTLRTLMKEALYDDWVPTVLGGFLAIIGVLLAAGGLYGAVSYATERRAGEFGVRVAVGAGAGQIAGLVLRQAALLCAAGVPIGVGLFVAAYHYYGAELLRDRPMEPAAIAAGAIIALAAVLAGAVLPAWRAARLDPVDVLRAE